MKANTGMFLIDDFGRQQISPRALLNRWIIPLERRIDYLTLITGNKLQIPFDELLIFSTNLDPKDLMDDAFLRRIRYKIHISRPRSTSSARSSSAPAPSARSSTTRRPWPTSTTNTT